MLKIGHLQVAFFQGAGYAKVLTFGFFDPDTTCLLLLTMLLTLIFYFIDMI